MPRVIGFDKGSKRRLKQIRWKLYEAFSLALLLVLAVGVGILVLIWEWDHEHRHPEPPPKVPQLRKPTQP